MTIAPARDVLDGITVQWTDGRGGLHVGQFVKPDFEIPPHYKAEGARYFVEPSGKWFWVPAGKEVEIVDGRDELLSAG